MSSASAIFEGHVRHHRRLPRTHGFAYPLAMLWLDLDELAQAFEGRWLWSIDRPNLAQWCRADYLGPASLPLREAVHEAIRAEGMEVPQGPIRMLTHPRYAGYAFNPVTFYFCYQPAGQTLATIVAEVTNTPWQQRHAYVLPVPPGPMPAHGWRWHSGKRLHVSPFMGMDRVYDWRLTAPREQLVIHMKVLHEGAEEFHATLALRRRPLDAAGLARLLWRYPLMTFQVIAAIHWQALRLWLKRVPVHDHPAKSTHTPRHHERHH